MFCSDVPVVEDGSLNGAVVHQFIYPDPGTPKQYEYRSSSFGRGHAKHQQEFTCLKNYGVAGQDVYGSKDRKIFVADGHGTTGLQAAVAAVQLEQYIYIPDFKAVCNDPQQAENDIRDSVVQYLRHATDSDFEYSGSTFAFMCLLEHKGRRLTITVNIGDSEALLIYQNKIHRTSCAHSWDDFTVYKRYCRGVALARNVCYNRWNASKHCLKDKNGEYRPIMLYEHTEKGPRVNEENAEWISELYIRKGARFEHGTQSVRVPTERHENWGSSVMLFGRARGQNMATFGDTRERFHTGVPLDMVHVYIHEVPANETVVALVQSDGISNSRTLLNCGLHAKSCKNAEEYIKSIQGARDDMSVAMFWSEPRLHV